MPHWTGFTFPKFGTKSGVTKVTVSFESLKFIVHFELVALENVKKEVLEVMKYVSQITWHPFPCFMCLSQNDMEWLKGQLNEDELTQVKTTHSILLKSKQHIYKVVPNIEDHTYLTKQLLL